ncbi:MAG: hypothetical protein EBZ62_09145, partial [Sphingobacteriia bacterium]|nr:hypothetical protein [Sphingobacteriia bacterium]
MKFFIAPKLEYRHGLRLLGLGLLLHSLIIRGEAYALHSQAPRDTLGSSKASVAKVSEGILAQIADKIILQSELETEFRNSTDQERQEGRFNPDSGEALRCMLFEQM